MTKTRENPPRTDILKAARQDAVRKGMARWFPRFCLAMMVIGFLNFIVFLAGDLYLGGEAWSGKVDGEKYFVWGYHQGKKGYTEVSRAAFTYSKWSVYTVMVTWPTSIIAAWASERLFQNPAD